MKINFLLPHTRLSGGVKALLEYANRLHKGDHDIRVFVPGKKLKWYHLSSRWNARNRGLQTLPSKTVDWMDNALSIELLPESGGHYLPDSDILVASAWQNAEFASQLPPQKGTLFYFVLHYESLWTRHKDLAKKTYDLSCQMLTCSTWLKNILLEEHDQTAEVLIIPVDREVFFCNKKKWNVIRRVAMLHHDYDWKGFWEGIEAIKQVKAQGYKVELVVFGEKLENPKPLFKKVGFNFEYHYRPTRKILQEIYVSCDIYLCPSWYEGLGLPSMEAMACRCALVTANTGGCLDYAVHGETALVSPSRDTKSLSDNIIRLLNDEGLMKLISQKGYEKISKINWQESCDQLISLFKKGQS